MSSEKSNLNKIGIYYMLLTLGHRRSTIVERISKCANKQCEYCYRKAMPSTHYRIYTNIRYLSKCWSNSTANTGSSRQQKIFSYDSSIHEALLRIIALVKMSNNVLDSWDDLPAEIWSCIFSLCSFLEVGRLGRVSKRLYACSKADKRWVKLDATVLTDPAFKARTTVVTIRKLRY